MVAAEDGESSPDASRTLRGGDTGVGIPRSAGVEGARRVSSDEAERNERQQRDEERDRLINDLPALETMRPYELPELVRRWAFWGGLAVAAVVGLLLVTQVAALIADIEAMAGPARWVLGGLGALCAAVILWLTARLAWALVRTADESLGERRGTRSAAGKAGMAAACGGTLRSGREQAEGLCGGLRESARTCGSRSLRRA